MDDILYHNIYILSGLTYIRFCWYLWKILYNMAASCRSDSTDMSSTACTLVSCINMTVSGVSDTLEDLNSCTKRQFIAR